jgi:hypothetical protein
MPVAGQHLLGCNVALVAVDEGGIELGRTEPHEVLDMGWDERLGRFTLLVVSSINARLARWSVPTSADAKPRYHVVLLA